VNDGKEPKKQTPSDIELEPGDSAIDIVYAQAVRTAHEFGWPAPARVEFEARYIEELAAHGPRDSE